jgi:hypothetical protein
VPDPNYNSHLNQAPSRNAGVNFNYVWDQSNNNWTPMGEIPQNLILSKSESNIHKFGSNPELSHTKTDEETIWDGEGLYIFPNDNGEPLQIKSSDNTDTQDIVVVGLDENFQEQSVTVTLTGTTSTNLDGSWSRVFRAYNNGSSDLAGDVIIHEDQNASKVYAKILASNNQTLMAIYTIPANYTGYLLKHHCSAQNTDNSSSINFIIHIKTREYGKVFRTKSIVSCSTNQSETETLPFPIKLEPKTDIIFNKISANSGGGSLNADFDIGLIS